MPAAYDYSNRLGRVLLAAMRAELGRERLNEVLQTAGQPLLATASLAPSDAERRFSFEVISALQTAVEKTLGAAEGRRLNTRIGREAFTLGLHDLETAAGIADLPARQMPLGMKLGLALEVFARVYGQFSDQVVRVSATATHYLWICERCPVCWRRQAGEPCCQLTGGLLEAAGAWVSGGRRFAVAEVQCKARGDRDCVFEIAKTPLD